MSIPNLLATGGLVMVPLLGLSILAMALVLERLVFWWQLTRQQDRVIQDTLALYRRSPRAAFQKLEQHANLPMARIFLAALELEQATPDEFRLALESAAQAELPLLRRFNTVFDTVISVAPLLGLLGTILGLIQSFSSLRLGDLGGTQTAGVTAGISEALISTAAGLIVAIITLLFANTFRGLYQRQVALIQEYGGQLELLHRRRQEYRSPPYAPTQ
ncbi:MULTISPECIES: MotA/TolQ/ExbB proton channel family protein [Thermoleptolyngbya]|jgi:biopolymer transport protein ExbB|uniref:MotA/TolQ/ExbB proton channel family protein n=1 Tax=Thermoleptolyngbya sichuanensis A183 TaxID=2737172 RepID=A0A6M8BDF6_9CYAN|nr:MULTISPECIES: MotA/TolQ/ExbB proton channel family protein [Thermoleptolyngbya]MBF2085966.1 MotA/TolQ/ExbB proton channel family protein [Thermoleptolyngbya sp. C42_A2020_037]MDG2617982.1 MotA/TolQ/ExbB proton channel family protein [Thermoleptolyngbya sichuanensis XZ-Cy5]QKD82300.1 MotA/TolQ/ExbB proton channel family protein [Thermoleptolyngbya sichuanensis A183]